MITRFWSIAALMVVRAMVGREQMSGWYFISLYSIYCEVLYTRKTGPTIDWYKSHCLKSDKFFKKTKIHLWSKLHHKGQQHSLKRNDCLINFWMSNSWIQFKSIKGAKKLQLFFLPPKTRAIQGCACSSDSRPPMILHNIWHGGIFRWIGWIPCTKTRSCIHCTKLVDIFHVVHAMYQN